MTPGLASIDQDTLELVSALMQVLHGLKRRLPADAQDAGRSAVMYKLYRLGPQRPSELAGCTNLDLSTVSRHVTALEREGLVHRLADPADGRAHRVEATPAGCAHVDELISTRTRMIADATASWTKSERNELERLLRRLADDLGEESGDEKETK